MTATLGSTFVPCGPGARARLAKTSVAVLLFPPGDGGGLRHNTTVPHLGGAGAHDGARVALSFRMLVCGQRCGVDGRGRRGRGCGPTSMSAFGHPEKMAVKCVHGHHYRNASLDCNRAGALLTMASEAMATVESQSLVTLVCAVVLHHIAFWRAALASVEMQADRLRALSPSAAIR